LTYLNSEHKCNATHDFQFTIRATCDEKAEDSKAVLEQSSYQEPCNPTVTITSSDACPAFSLHSLWDFTSKYGEIFATLFMALGVFLMIRGGRNYEFTMYIAAQFAVAMACIMIAFMFMMPPASPEWTIWLCIVVSLMIGSVAGSFSKQRARTGIIFIGALLGIFAGFGLYNVLIYNFSENNPLLGLWLTVMFSAIAVAMLCLHFFDYAVIIGSSLIGSYFFYRGLSVFLGGYPNEFVIYQDYVNGKMKEMPVSFHMYMVTIVVTAVASFAMQTNMMRNDKSGSYQYRQEGKNRS
jgi:hypothetical protein